MARRWHPLKSAVRTHLRGKVNNARLVDHVSRSNRLRCQRSDVRLWNEGGFLLEAIHASARVKNEFSDADVACCKSLWNTKISVEFRSSLRGLEGDAEKTCSDRRKGVSEAHRVQFNVRHLPKSLSIVTGFKIAAAFTKSPEHRHGIEAATVHVRYRLDRCGFRKFVENPGGF